MFQIKAKVKILSATSKPYKIEGNEGISHKVRFMHEDAIYEVKSTSEQVTMVTPYVGKEVDATVVVDSRKEVPALRLAEVVSK